MEAMDNTTSRPPVPSIAHHGGPKTSCTVYVIAPSSIGKRSSLEAYRRIVRDRLPTMRTHITDSMFKEGADPFYANTDRFRADDLANALTGDSAVVWCALGGQGATRLIPYLEALPEVRKRRIREARKVFIGYSDITILHVYLQTVYGWQTIHGTMLELIVDGAVDQRSVDALVSLVDGRASRVEHRLARVLAQQSGDRGEPAAPEPPFVPLRSRVAGGNLTLVRNTIGTAFSFSGAGKIVFPEDIGEKPKGLERSLDHLKLAGVLDGAEAVVFGLFKDSEPPALVQLVFRRFAASVPFPVFSTDRIGHGYVNDPLPLNTDATLAGHIVDGRVSYTLTVDNVYAKNDSGEEDRGQVVNRSGCRLS